jgi:hypothetical protein
MPPFILWAVGLFGAAVAGRFLYRESQRINAELYPEKQPDEAPPHGLQRDPTSGVYRPK